MSQPHYMHDIKIMWVTADAAANRPPLTPALDQVSVFRPVELHHPSFNPYELSKNTTTPLVSTLNSVAPYPQEQLNEFRVSHRLCLARPAPFKTLGRDPSRLGLTYSGRSVTETSLRPLPGRPSSCRLGRHLLRDNDDCVISGSPCTYRYVRNALPPFLCFVPPKSNLWGLIGRPFVALIALHLPHRDPAQRPQKLPTAQCARQHEVLPNQHLDKSMERDIMESQQPPQAQLHHFPARPNPYPHARSQQGVLQSLPAQLALRTANTTPASSPGPFSPPNTRPSMFAPSVSEGSTPGPGAGSPLLHPLQHHKVRE
jgi:hypothetical protein